LTKPDLERLITELESLQAVRRKRLRQIADVLPLTKQPSGMESIKTSFELGFEGGDGLYGNVSMLPVITIRLGERSCG
ncbi:MAG: hypothetical protein VXX55_12980, partial [Planctomycetota bacterium]|nr:hypothetical protein [Planctomycetota bacterium]